MATLTTRRLTWFRDTMAQAVEHLPKIMGDVTDTVELLEHTQQELERRDRTIDTLNLQIGDLRGQMTELQRLLQEEYRKTARAELLITSTVKQLAESTSFHEAADAVLADIRENTRKQLDKRTER